ncbi:MAG: hypothetical protein SNJ84_06245, partial [Verrucomicrobiia bacterium]
MTVAEVAELMAPVRVGWDDRAAGREGVREVELWRWFVALAALALLGEGWLTFAGRRSVMKGESERVAARREEVAV